MNLTEAALNVVNMVEGNDSDLLDKAKAAIEQNKGKLLGSVGYFEKAFGKKNVSMVTKPLPMIMIEITSKKLLIAVNKKYAKDPDLVVGDIAIGFSV